MYFTERHADDSFAYELTVSQPGSYLLILQFVELHFESEGKRVFDVKFGDYVVLKDLDVYAEVGNSVALDEYLEFELKEDEIFFKNELCPNAFKFQSNKLVVAFEKKDRDLPKVDGMILIRGTLEGLVTRTQARPSHSIQPRHRLSRFDEEP